MSAPRAGGFHAFVGNPPFLGGKRISTVLGESTTSTTAWLAMLHAEGNSNSDLVAHFSDARSSCSETTARSG
jgi:hypothetical protein